MGSPVPKKFKITTPYGKPGKMWKIGYHGGVDYACPTGTEIYAARKGKVLEAGTSVTWGPSYGTAVVIDHGKGVRAVYAHLSKTSVKVGEMVKGGQVVGLSGNTGNSSGPHLHLEARVSPWKYGNKDIDPKDLIAEGPKEDKEEE
jgi:murein DD-endopeptidase MepM/ murein hydrolase activator NlpD